MQNIGKNEGGGYSIKLPGEIAKKRRGSFIKNSLIIPEKILEA